MCVCVCVCVYVRACACACVGLWTDAARDVTRSPEVSPSRVGSPDLEHGPATVRAEELPLFDDAMSLDAQIGTHTGVRERGIGELGACNQVHVVAVLHDCLRV